MRLSSALALLASVALSLGPASVSAQAKSNKKVPAAAAKKKAEPEKKSAPGAGSASPSAKKVPERKTPAAFAGSAGRELPRLEDAARNAIVEKKRDEEIESLKRIIPKFPDGSPQKAELLYNLAELYWEKSKYLYQKEMLKFLDEQKKVEEAHNRGEKLAEAKEDHRESELYRREAMTFYETILREYPAYERKDEVLFALGYNLYETGKRDQAVKRYEELIKSYPNSRFIGDVYVELGNHYFDVANDLSKARPNFEKAFLSTTPKIKSYALYKLAWCDFNVGEHEKALQKLQEVVSYTENQKSAGRSEKELTDLKTEALNDMVIVWVQLNRSDDAIAYYKQHAGKNRQPRLIGKMAYQLADAGHHDNAIKSFRYLLSEAPMAETAPDYQQAIIKSYEGLRQRENVKAEVKKLATLYRPGSEWWTANASKKEVLRNGFNVAEEAMRTVVTDYHQEAQKTKQVETYRLARDIYKQYVEAFAAGEDENFISDFAFNLKFYYAEILWALEEWELAAREYDSVVAFKIPNRETAKEVAQEKYRQSSAYNSILAYDKLVKIERGQIAKSALKEGQKVDEQKKKGTVEKQQKVTKRTVKELQEQPLTGFEQKLVAACDSYNKLFPNNSDEIDVRYQAAVVYYDRNHFVDAAQRFGEIIMKWPEEKRSQDAADLSMSVLEEKEEWAELNKLSRQFAANKKLSKPGSEFAKRVSGVVEGSQYKWVDEVIYKKEKNPSKAAESFLAYVAEFPKGDNSDRALTYAMIIFREANQLDRGIETGERVLKEYPGSIFELKARNALAKFYEQTAQFLKSAEMNEAFIAAYDAAAGTKAVGYDNIKGEKAAAAKKPEPKKAAAKGKEPEKIARKVDPAEAESLIKEAGEWVADAYFNAGLWWEGVGKPDKAIAAYERYVKRFKDKKDAPEVAFNIGLVQSKDKKPAEAIKTFDAFTTTYAKDSRVGGAKLFDARYQQLLLHRAAKNNDASDRLVKELIAAYPKLSEGERKNDRAFNGYAHARFLALEPMWKQFTDIKFSKVSTLKNDLAAKVKKIQEVEKSYTEVAAIGAGDYTLASVTRIGLAYADFAQNFLDSPNPPRLDEEQLEMYRSELENRAFPLEEKAIEALESSLKKSYELNVYNEWTLAAQEKLNKFRPGAYGKVREVPFRGSEFFVTAPFLKDAQVTVAKESKLDGSAAGAGGK
jgi:tetratricopeptide (TPR) repeat protein